jgi:hypothetical protein
MAYFKVLSQNFLEGLRKTSAKSKALPLELPCLVSYPMCTRSLTPRINWPEYVADHSPPSSAKVKKNVWSYISTPPYIFMV